MKGLVLGIALIAGTLVAGAAPALANPASPGGGPAFGQHISGHAPEHPVLHGAMFGECVSMMAQGEGCSHHPHE